MAKTEEKKQVPSGKNAGAQDAREELAYLRQTCSSLVFRGHYAQCIKTIEDNLKLFYEKDRWLDNLFAMLRLHQKCYPSLNKSQPHEEYLSGVLQKYGIPFVLARLLKTPDASITWSAEYFNTLAVQSLDEGDAEASLAYCDIMLKISPGSSGTYFVKGNMLEQLGRLKEAAILYGRALEINPNDHLALGGLAMARRKENPQKAMEYIGRAIELDSENAKHYAEKSTILLEAGDVDGAAEALDGAIKADPYNAEYPYQKGEIYHQADNRGKAITQYRLAIARNDKHAPSLLRLAQYAQDKQPVEALGYITTAAAYAPDDPEVCLLRARLLLRTRDLVAAVRQFRHLLELDPNSAEAHAGLGEIYLADGDFERSIKHLDEAIRLAPGVAEYHMGKAAACLKIGDQEGAVEAYKAALSHNKREVRALFELAKISAGPKPKEAIQYLDKALVVEPENSAYRVMKGELLMQLGNRDQALECFDAASKSDPANAALHAQLGRLLMDYSYFASAMHHFRRAVALDPHDAESFYFLAKLVYDIHPGIALKHINSAIENSVIRGEYYFLKTRIFIAATEDKGAQSRLQAMLEAGSFEGEAGAEVAQLLEGDGVHLAFSYINRALEMDPDNPAYLCLRAHLHYQMGQAAKAMKQYQTLLATNPDQHEALFGMARILAGKKDQKALEYFDKAINLSPAVQEYHAEKAAFLAQDGEQYEQAVQEYEAAIRLNNQSWNILLEKARLHDSHGDTGPAVDEYRHVLMLRPDIAEAAARMGVLLMQASPSIALIYIDQAIKYEPEAYVHRAWRARAQVELEQPEQAEQCILEAVALGEDSADCHYTLATVLAPVWPEKALEHCLRAVGKDSGKIAYQLQCGDLYLAQGELGEARPYFEKAVELDAHSHEALEKIACLAYLEGEPDSLERIDAALATQPDCASCLHIKGRILYELAGDTAGAIEQLSAAVRHAPENEDYHEALVVALTKNRNFIKLAKERHRFDKARKRAMERLHIEEVPTFEEIEEQDPTDESTAVSDEG